jgi:hypothetical protein
MVSSICWRVALVSPRASCMQSMSKRLALCTAAEIPAAYRKAPIVADVPMEDHGTKEPLAPWAYLGAIHFRQGVPQRLQFRNECGRHRASGADCSIQFKRYLLSEIDSDLRECAHESEFEGLDEFQVEGAVIAQGALSFFAVERTAAMEEGMRGRP